MHLAHDPSLLAALRTPTRDDPWRVLVSGCLAHWPCGTEATDYGAQPTVDPLLASPLVRAFPFCPEQFALGAPRAMPDIHGGDGRTVLLGKARVRDEHGNDLTEAMLAGAAAMRDLAVRERVDFAVLMDMSAACGSQVISDGCRFDPVRRYQRGVGVATARLLEARVPVVAQRDLRTMALLRARIDSSFTPPAGLVDHHEHPWVLANLPLRS